MIDKPGLLELGDEIEGVTYVPLEMTADDASLIDGVYDYAVTDRYIYVLPVKEPRIVLFDRQGRFIRTLVKEGQGPGEFTGILPCIQVDERNDRLFLFSNNRVWEYTLEGEFVGQSTHEYSVIYMRHIDKDRFAAISFPFQPFDGGGFGLGIFSEKGDTIAIKNDFYSFLLPHEKSGFTTSVAAAYSDAQNSVLFKTGSNDTVFSVSADQIKAACVLDLKNSDAEVIRSLDITDMSNLRFDKKAPKDIFVQDMLELPKCYYFRLWYNQGSCIASVDKKTGNARVEKCEMPSSIKELADANLQHGMEGTRSYRNFPVWGRVVKDELVQVVTPYELNLYRSLRSVTIPEELDLKEEEGNPVFVFYSLSQSE
ncbi:MAG: 6-bladed beta-propeller [Parabacteroides sp.]|nr:6-bladed beta-propeller [Parabacteroides sp.]